MTLSRALALAVLLFTAATAHAHKPSDSYLSLGVDGARIDGQWDIALRDLDLAIGLDGDGDGAITWGEVRGRHSAIASYALSRLSLSSGPAACTLTPSAHLVDEHTDGTYAVLRFEGQCAAPVATLSVDYSLLFDVDPQHRGIAKVTGLGGVSSIVFSSEHRHYAFEAGRADRARQLATFLIDGIRHIAAGFDHILFLAALLLPAVMVREGRTWRPATGLPTTLRNVVAIVTAFTLAHSVTLSLAVLGIVRLPSRLVESLIALSVVMTAIDNIHPFLPRQRWRVAFGFGLVHGLGFAGALLEMGLPRESLALSLVGFNLGVEAGQLALVALLLPLAYALRSRDAYPRIALGAGSALIAFVAFGWLVERAFSFTFMPF
jgi:hypothetical protein